MGRIRMFFKLLRVHQWVKNTLIFAAPLGASIPLNSDNFFKGMTSFFAMSLVASSVYLVNDFRDRKIDLLHPTKKFRPIASGEFPALLSLPLCFVLAISSFVTTGLISSNSLLILVVYFVINIAYSLKLKQVAILELGIVASGYSLRILYGAEVFNLLVSRWLMVATFTAAFGIVVAKRKSEIVSSKESHLRGRSVLSEYTSGGLQSAATLAFGTSFTTYSLWLFEHNSNLQLLPLACEILGLVLFVQLLMYTDKGELESPERLVERGPTLIVFLFFTAANLAILYL